MNVSHPVKEEKKYIVQMMRQNGAEDVLERDQRKRRGLQCDHLPKKIMSQSFWFASFRAAGREGGSSVLGGQVGTAWIGEPGCICEARRAEPAQSE